MIRWTEKAQSDLVGIVEWIRFRDPVAAERIADRILQLIERLDQFPFLGRAGRVAGTRELVIGRSPYIVIYTIEDRVPVMLRVLHGAMQWPPQEGLDA